MKTAPYLFAIAVLTASTPLLADPTRPPGPEEIRAFLAGEPDGQRQPGWRLQSVLISDDRRIAVINGRRVTVGDRLAGAEVIDIQPGRAKLRHRGGDIHLNIERQTKAVRHTSGDRD